MPFACIPKIVGCFLGWTWITFTGKTMSSACVYVPQQCFSTVQQTTASAQLTAVNRGRNL